MSGVNSKVSRSDLTPPSEKRLKLENSQLTLARIGMTEQMQMESTTSTESTADQVLRIPDELLAHIFGYLAADSDLEALSNVRLVCSLWKREAFFALKTNLSLLPWILVNGDSVDVNEPLSQSKNHPVLKSLESCIKNVKPGCGLPLQLVGNKWTPELESFLLDYSSDIVSFWIYSSGFGGIGMGSFRGFPEDLGGIELPSLEHASFSALAIREVKRECDEFVKALSFWKELVKVSKEPKACQLNIGINYPRYSGISPDHEVFDQLEWSRVNSLQCSYEFLHRVTTSNELSSLQQLECSMGAYFFREFDFSLEKVAHLEKMEFGSPIEWRLDHLMENLKILTLMCTTIVCGQSPSNYLPNLRKIVVSDYSEPFTAGSSVSSLISGGGEYENVVNLSLTERWTNFTDGIDDMAVRLFGSFRKLTELEWTSLGIHLNEIDDMDENKNALLAAPVIFSRLEFLTRLKLVVPSASEKEVVELVSGITFAEVPHEEGSWPTLLDGNPRSISNLRHLQSFALNLKSDSLETVPTTISMRHTRFLFIAAFRTMATLEELFFRNVQFADISCVTEWQQMGRKIEVIPPLPNN